MQTIVLVALISVFAVAVAAPKFPTSDEFRYSRLENSTTYVRNITFHYNFPTQNFRMDWYQGSTSSMIFTDGIQYSLSGGKCYVTGTKWNATLYNQLGYYSYHYYYIGETKSKEGEPCHAFSRQYEKILVSVEKNIMIESWLYKDALYERFVDVNIGKGSASDPNLYKLPVDKSECKKAPESEPILIDLLLQSLVNIRE
jgi:hypothetical protein